MSLYFLETPYRDEFFYSVAARTFHTLRERSSRQFAVRLVGAPRLNVDLGVGFAVTQRDFVKNASPFAQTTLAAFLTSFTVVPLKRWKFGEAMNNGDAATASYLLGRMGARRRAEPFLRYCAACAREQRTEFGEAYWTCLPQIFGLTHCSHHKMPFIASTVSRHRPSDFVRLEDALVPQTGCCAFPDVEAALIDLSSEAAGLLSFNPTWDSGRLNRAWREVFYAAGLKWRVKGAAKHLTAKLEERFGSAYLAWAKCQTCPTSEHSWVSRFLRKPAGEPDPIRHLLVLRTLGYHLADLERWGSCIFGHPRINDSALVCINPVCGNFQKAYRKQTRIFHHPHLREEVAQFTCVDCEQTVEQMLAPQPGPTTLRIVDRGKLWTEELRQLWMNPAISVRQIAVRLDAESLTIKRHAVKAGLPFPRVGPRMAKKAPPAPVAKPPVTTAERESRRGAWLEALGSQKTVSAAREVAGDAYAWLWRHDRGWLSKHRPTMVRPLRASGSKVDWKTREQELMWRVESGFFAIINRSPPQLCSTTALLREIRAERYIGFLNKMPTLRQSVTDLAETRVNFALRRIDYVEPNLPPGFSRKDLTDAAGLRAEMLEIEPVRLRVEEVLRKARESTG